MVRWRRLERSDNVHDRRGMKAPAMAAGAGGLGIIGLLIALFLGGGDGAPDLAGLLGGLGGGTASQETLPAVRPEDDAGAFVEAILGTTETFWTDTFAAAGRTYDPPTLVLFTGATSSACGGATSAVGPHYCPPDATVYIDLDFFDELQTRFGAQGGDFAEAYVIAHEVAHHVQNLLGISDAVDEAQRSNSRDANSLSVKLELQADCFAGAWAQSIFQRGGVLEPGDIEEGLDAAAAVGDDRIQATSTGRIDPESWTHGSSEQRVQWFTSGYQGGPGACDTFAG